jgi:hypothetical protein
MPITFLRAIQVQNTELYYILLSFNMRGRVAVLSDSIDLNQGMHEGMHVVAAKGMY